MAAPLEIRVGVNEADAVRGVKKLGKSLEEVGDDFDKLAREGDQALDKIDRSAADTGKKIKKEVSGGLKEAGKEANQSGREAAASFGGGFEDVADFAQETLANAFQGFGPIGAAAGLAVAGALGAALAGAQDAQEKLAEAREGAVDLATTLYENKGTLPVQDAVDSLFEVLGREAKPNGDLQKIIDGFADFGSVIDDVKDSSRLSKQSVADIFDALKPGDVERSAAVLRKVNEQIEDLRDSRSGWVPVWDEDYQSLRGVQRELEGVITKTELAKELNSSMADELRAEEVAEKIETIGQAWQDAATDAADYVTEQDGVTSFDWSKYLADAEATLAAANEYKRKIVTLPDDIRAEAESIFSESGAQAANSYTDAYINASAEDQARFVAAAQANGAEAGRAAGEALAGEAESAAVARSSHWKGLEMPVRTGSVDDSSVTSYRASTVVVPVRFQKLNGIEDWG